MLTPKKFLLFLQFILLIFWAVPVNGAVVEGPMLGYAEGNWTDFGLRFRAEVDVDLLSVRFPNQGKADLIQLIRESDSALLAGIPVPAGNPDAVVTIDYPLVAQEVYRLVATTPSNKYYGYPIVPFPTGNTDITVLSSYFFGIPYCGLWFSFNDITTGAEATTGSDDTVMEAVIDIKPGSAVNSINLKSKGVVPVAILTAGDFDAVNVDAESVIFAGAAPVMWQIEDVDGDGNEDMILHFKTAELTDLSADSIEAVLSGNTFDGIPFAGIDIVNIVHGK